MTFIRKNSLLETNVAGRVRTSNQRSQIGYLQAFAKDLDRFDEETAGTATSVYEGNGIGSVNMVVATSGDFVIRKGKEANYYYPGNPQKIELTCSKFQNQTNVTKRMGYYSSSTVSPFSASLDGFTFESDGSEHYVRIYRSGTVVWELPSAQWLRQDKVSVWSPENFGFYVIEFLYLGGAIAQFKILIGDELVTVAEYTHAGVDINTFVKSPNQPIRYEIRSDAASAAGEFNHMCGDVASEGIGEDISIPRAFNNGAVPLTSLTANVRYAFIGLRLKSTELLQVADVYGLSVLAASTDQFLVELFLGGTVVSPTWADIPNSFMQGMDGYAVANAGALGDIVHSGGVLLTDFYMEAETSKESILENARRLGSLIDGTPEEIFVCLTSIGANAQALASINWKQRV